MLKITIKDEDANLRITVEGELTDQLARVLEANWHNAAVLRRSKKVLVDLCGVTSIDSAGREVLGSMIADGAEFSVSGPKTAYIIDTLRSERKQKIAHREAEKLSLICAVLLFLAITLFAVEKAHAHPASAPVLVNELQP